MSLFPADRFRCSESPAQTRSRQAARFAGHPSLGIGRERLRCSSRGRSPSRGARRRGSATNGPSKTCARAGRRSMYPAAERWPLSARPRLSDRHLGRHPRACGGTGGPGRHADLLRGCDRSPLANDGVRVAQSYCYVCLPVNAANQLPIR